jgi:hypothetical protein
MQNRFYPNKQKIITMKAFLFASLAASAAAFAPQSAVVTSPVSVSGFANDYVGGDGPEPLFIGKTGSVNFDPAGFAEVRTYGIPYVAINFSSPYLDVHVPVRAITMMSILSGWHEAFCGSLAIVFHLFHHSPSFSRIFLRTTT